jgi:hypothetical protein
MTEPLLRPYRPFVIDRPRPQSDLYALSDRLIAQDVVAVVRAEGPLHADLLYQRVAKLYSVERAGSEVRRVVDRALREATRTGDVTRRGRFYWPKGLERVEPRTAGPRSVAQIAPEELQEAVVLVLRALGPRPREELIRAVARALGFQRTGSSLTAGIGAAVDALLASGRAVDGGDGIMAAGSR